MSASRVVLLVAVLAWLALSVHAVARGPGSSQSDPTSYCYDPQPSKLDGPTLADSGWWDLIGLESTYSSSYSVLCAFRGLYFNGPAGSNTAQYGPWHGNENDTNCGAPYLSQFAQSTERANPSFGALASRVNKATNGNVLTSFKMVGTCNNSTSNLICAGLCVGTATYDQDSAALQQDPTYTETSYDAASPYVVTRLNSTQQVNGYVQQNTAPYATAVVSAITSLTKCIGMESPCSQSLGVN